MFRKLCQLIADSISAKLSIEQLSLDQLRKLAENLGYELKRKLRWTDPYETHAPTHSRGRGTIALLEMKSDPRLERDDQKRIRKLLKAVPKSGHTKRVSRPMSYEPEMPSLVDPTYCRARK